MRYYRRLSLREIGEALRLSEDAVRMRIKRALERLRRQLGPAAAEALPALYANLMDPDQEHDLYLANAIKAIDPGSPKPLFHRDDLLS